MQKHQITFLSRYLRAFLLFGAPLAGWHYVRDRAVLSQEYEIILAVTSAFAYALVFALLQLGYERWRGGESD